VLVPTRLNLIDGGVKMATNFWQKWQHIIEMAAKMAAQK